MSAWVSWTPLGQIGPPGPPEEMQEKSDLPLEQRCLATHSYRLPTGTATIFDVDEAFSRSLRQEMLFNGNPTHHVLCPLGGVRPVQAVSSQRDSDEGVVRFRLRGDSDPQIFPVRVPPHLPFGNALFGVLHSHKQPDYVLPTSL